jgi:hypothetical protein
MSWNRTHEWWQALREVSAEIELRQDATLPWQPRYAEIFGDRAGLRRALGYRWTLMQQAQVDGDRRSATSAELAARNLGLLLVLDSGRIEEATPAAVRDELVSA